MTAIPPFIVAPMLDFVRAELIVNCLVVFVMLSVVGLRTYARINGAGIGLDDILILLAAPLGVGMLVCQGFLSMVGTGYELKDNMQFAVNAPFIFFMAFCMEVIYVPCLALSKASMLLFYRRVFSTPGMQRAVDIALGLVVVWTIAFECACIFLCNPVSFFWNRFGEGQCGDFLAMICTLIATNALGDLIVMIMPMRTVWSLQMKKTEKIGIMSSFALGLACIVIAIFRVIYLIKVDMASNVTGTMATTVLLFTLEPNLAILSVSIPMLRPLITSYRKRNQSSRLYDDKLSSASGNGLRTIGGGGGGGAGSQGHRSKFSKADPLEETVWEMERYRPANETTIGGTSSPVLNINETSTLHLSDDDSGSAKSLTKKQHQYLPPMPASPAMPLPSNNVIGVKTTWTVTHGST
ncbi:uncharacterized protein B0I36DRAFT_425109 [Microdochium trichocladiopsis]|uniref:Rhodopsin domain-containing protein n=1 Tax=Microdochium trichocladiopsis TaxID=1682393 RepID=A0A9P8XVS8_9PEZI|nr:uncharacterized protein B0I36DRAFT_425109 [Microdochium trichocladiopsis]KAH7021451.1 hypothetical protein B0I36DRAFT_425109 [Microdochium trichocladiopsis]